MAANNMPTCFIIMPITVPPAQIPACYPDSTHFRNILEHLFVPAVTAAGYEPIQPITKGGEIIIAEIIHHLARADMVLCDISCHNPNVFYELGIRTALDKPVAMVRDTSTAKIPFDTAAINIEEYPCDLRPWNVATSRDRIASHIKDSANKAGGRNAAWRYFGVTEQAEFAPQKNTPKDKLDVILARLDRIESSQVSTSIVSSDKDTTVDTVEDYLSRNAAGALIDQYVSLNGRAGKIVSVHPREMVMEVKIGEDRHTCDLRDRRVLRLEVFPF